MATRTVKISDQGVERMRKLKGLYQSDNPETEVTNKQTVEKALKNEIERLDND